MKKIIELCDRLSHTNDEHEANRFEVNARPLMWDLVAYAKKLEEENHALRDALEFYANGKALRVKPEKAHLWEKDYDSSDHEWYLRSMSDWDSTLLAKEVLAKYPKGEK